MNSSVPRPAQDVIPESLYFAFGNNLQLEQMAKRCPESRYMGIGLLHGYRWQINQRGYANVIPSEHDEVAGLCFLLSARDEARLDVSEGVAVGAYEKELMDVELFLPKATLVGRKVSEIIEHRLIPGSIDGGHRETLALANDDGGQVTLGPSGVTGQQANHRDAKRLQVTSQVTNTSEIVRALVYISRRHTNEGDPWEEYMGRINLGIADPLILGISEMHVDTYIRRYVPA